MDGDAPKKRARGDGNCGEEQRRQTVRMSHLEAILFEWYDWRGYVVKRNVKVGKLSHGGWEGELDIVAYHPTTRELVHVEPSIDALSWAKRE